MIRLRTLGALDLRGSGGEELRAVLAQPRRVALLAYLALATPRGTQRRDTVLALFWPELDVDRARNALGQAVHFLRRSIDAAAVVSNGDGLAVDWSNFWCDAAAFEEALDTDRVGEALALYRGDLLEGFHIDDAPEFERWLESERARLAARYTKAVETVATEREEAGDLDGAVTHWRMLSARDPYSSRLTLRLMRALTAAGDPASALAQARQHERLLREELAIAPDAEVAAFVRQLQAGLPGNAARPVIHASVEPSTDGTGSAKEPIRAEPAAAYAGGRSRRVAMLAVALVLASVGAAAATFMVKTPDRQLQELYRRGQNAEVNRSMVGIETAMQYYRNAIERDSGFALGYAAISQAYGHLAHYDFAPKGASLDSARILAEHAVKLDSTLSETRTALALSLGNSGHFAMAERELRSAIRMGPSNAHARAWYGWLLIALGRGDEALAEAELALKLDPLGPRLAHSAKTQATYLITGRRPELKLPTADRRPILKVEPGEAWARAHQAVELADEGRCAEARTDISLAQRHVPDSNMLMLAFAGLVHVSCGDSVQARTMLARMKRRPDARNHAMRVAILHTRFGERDSAFAWLAHHNEWMLSEVATLRSAPWLDSLRSDPRFPRLMRQLGMLSVSAAETRQSAGAGAGDGVSKDVYLRDMYVRGRNAERSRSQVGLATARQAYERAIARDSTFALGYAGLAGVYELLGNYGFMPFGPTRDSARIMARRAFILDSNLSATRTAVAMTLADAGKFEAAEREYQRAIVLDASDALAHVRYSLLLVALGRGADAQREAQLAAKLDPVGSRIVASMQRYAEWLITGQRPYRQLPPRERRPFLADEPGDPWAIARQAEDLAEAGECAEARTDLASAQRLAPDNVRMRPFMGRVEWWCGERSRTHALLDDMKGRSDARDNSFDVALMHTFLGEKDSAFAWLENHKRWSAVELAMLSASPYVDPLRSDTLRFLRLQRRLGVRK